MSELVAGIFTVVGASISLGATLYAQHRSERTTDSRRKVDDAERRAERQLERQRELAVGAAGTVEQFALKYELAAEAHAARDVPEWEAPASQIRSVLERFHDRPAVRDVLEDLLEVGQAPPSDGKLNTLYAAREKADVVLARYVAELDEKLLGPPWTSDLEQRRKG